MEMKNIKILFVDDDKTILNIIKTYFGRKNFSVLLAENGVEGYKLAKAEKPYVIVSDLMMPVMDGYEFCRLIRNDDDLKDIPFIMLTAREAKENCVKGFKAGINDYIVKPFNMYELYLKIEAFVKSYLNHLEIIETKKVLEFQQQQSEAILNSINEAVCVINQDCKVIRINENFKNLLNFHNKKIIGLPYKEVIKFKEKDVLLDTYKKDKTNKNKRVVIYTNDNIQKEIILNSVKYKYNDLNFIIVIVITDITETKKYENLSEEILGVISHELRTPLTAIKGCVETLLLNQDTDVFEIADIKDFINIINDESDRLVNTVNELLSVAELKKSFLKIDKKENDIRDIINESIQRLKKIINGQKQIIITNYNSVYCKMVCDNKLMTDAFYHIISNAVKFSDDEAEIIINVFDKEDYIYIEIIDNGCGISKEDINNIFDKFYLSDSSISRAKTGIGVGLTIAKAYIEINKGIISVESEVNSGTKVTVKFKIDIGGENKYVNKKSNDCG